MWGDGEQRVPGQRGRRRAWRGSASRIRRRGRRWPETIQRDFHWESYIKKRSKPQFLRTANYKNMHSFKNDGIKKHQNPCPLLIHTGSKKFIMILFVFAFRESCERSLRIFNNFLSAIPPSTSGRHTPQRSGGRSAGALRGLRWRRLGSLRGHPRAGRGAWGGARGTLLCILYAPCQGRQLIQRDQLLTPPKSPSKIRPWGAHSSCNNQIQYHLLNEKFQKKHNILIYSI